MTYCPNDVNAPDDLCVDHRRAAAAAGREALRKAVHDALDAGVPLEDIDGIVYLATLKEAGQWTTP